MVACSQSPRGDQTTQVQIPARPSIPPKTYRPALKNNEPWPIIKCVLWQSTGTVTSQLLASIGREGVPEAVPFPERKVAGYACMRHYPGCGIDSGHRLYTGTKKVATKEKRWYKDVGLGFKTPTEAINGTYIGASAFAPSSSRIFTRSCTTRQEVPLHWRRFHSRSYLDRPRRFDEDDPYHHYPPGLPPLHPEIQCV